MPGIISQYAPGEPIRYLVYSHGHTDHVGGSYVFKNVHNLKVVAQELVAKNLKIGNNPNILIPNVTFQNRKTIHLGGETVKLEVLGTFHSNDADTAVYFPKHKLLIAIDTLTPGSVPFKNFEVSPDVGQYVAVFDAILKYDFDYILTGHLGFLGNRQVVVDTKNYVLDVKAEVFKALAAKAPNQRIGEAFQALGSGDNVFLAFRYLIESVAKEAAKQITLKWKDKLAGVDVWSEGHCETMFLYLYTH